MANKTIPQLNQVSAATDLDFLVITNSGETTTSKITRQDLLSGTTEPQLFQAGTGSDSIRASYLPASEASNTRTFSVGDNNTASGAYASVVGGINGTASGLRSSVFGGDDNNATANTSATLGGFGNTAGGQFTITLGGRVSSITGEGGGIAAADSSSWTSAPYSFGAGLNNVDYTGGGKRGNAAIGANECVLSYMEQSGIYSTHESDILGTSGNEVKRSFIMGGSGNTINANVNKSGILGGNDNIIAASAENVVIIGGNGITGDTNNTTYVDKLYVVGKDIKATNNDIIINSPTSVNNDTDGFQTILGGNGNTINANSQGYGIIVGSFESSINTDASNFASGVFNARQGKSSGYFSGVYSGWDMRIKGGSYNATIGGEKGVIETSSNRSVLVGGATNTINNHNNSVMLGGSNNTSLYADTAHAENNHTFKTETFDTISGGTVSGTVAVDLSQGTIWKFTIGGNITSVDFSGWREGQRIEFIVVNSGTYTVSTMTISGGGSVYAKGGSINPTNNGITKYKGLIVDGDLYLNEELDFQAL